MHAFFYNGGRVYNGTYCLQWKCHIDAELSIQTNARMYERLRQQSLEGYWKLFCNYDSQSHFF